VLKQDGFDGDKLKCVSLFKDGGNCEETESDPKILTLLEKKPSYR